MLHLEQKIAELERIGNLVADIDAAAAVNDATASRSRRGSRSHAKVLETATLSLTKYLIPSLFRTDTKVQHYGKLFYPSERPPIKIPVRGVLFDASSRAAGRAYAAQTSSFGARDIPIEVAEKLFKNYKTEMLTRFPCFLEEELVTYFRDFYNEEFADSDPAQLAQFIIPMILAISSLTSRSLDAPKVAALSEALQRDALQHAELLRHSSLSTLQCMLLLIQLGLLLPDTCNCWYMTGEAMRMAVGMGLHQEPDPSLDINPVQAEMRRRIFWTVRLPVPHLSAASGLVVDCYSFME